MANHGPNDIWSQMGYVPPRGPCNHNKYSLMSPRCPCLRFMAHPLKASSTYDCDGCGHHASFHDMENKTENEIIRRWQAEDQVQRHLLEGSHPPQKRRRGEISDSDSIPADEPSNATLTTNSGNLGYGKSKQLISEGLTRPLLEWIEDENGGHWKDDDDSINSKPAQRKVSRRNARPPGQGTTKSRGRGGSRK